ncbi:LysR family transcriptional regulator [Microbaculum marinum]|uniref:LysR family transcriptional regulator n=1 Tax=Microbaculum marinum TaxID=1764581 RepID=A0AAW9RNE7_9HYPH
MDIRQLRYFVRIVESRSFTRAAETLLISQPAIGLQVRKLEEELGVTLLVRHSRGVEPTREGEVLLKSARNILAEMDQLAQAVRDCSAEAHGKVRLGLAPSLSVLFAEPLMSLAAKRLPGVDLECIESTSPLLKQWVAERSIDLAMGCEDEPHPDVREQSLFSEALYLVGSGRQSKPIEEAVIPFRSLAGRQILLADPMRSGLVQKKIKAAVLATGREVSITAVHPSVEVVKLLVEDGKGETILPWSSIRRECQQGRLSARRVVDPDLLRHALVFSHRAHPISHAQGEVLKLINDAIREERDLAPSSAFAGSHELQV